MGKIAKTIGAFGLGISTLTIAGFVVEGGSQKIEQPRWEQIVERRKNEEGFSGDITIKFDPTVFGPYSKKIGKKSYIIYSNKSYLDEKTLYHELFHIFDGHCDLAKGIRDYVPLGNLLNIPLYFGYYEPRALYLTWRNSGTTIK